MTKNNQSTIAILLSGIAFTSLAINMSVSHSSFLASPILIVIITALITLAVIMFIRKQQLQTDVVLTELNACLDLNLPVAEQLNLLKELSQSSNDLLSHCSKSIFNRIDHLFQQKKSLSTELNQIQKTQERLQKAKQDIEHERDSAVAAPKLKSEFLSRMGDEITTPMKSVVSMLKLLSEYPFDSEPKQLLNIAKRSMRSLVNNLNNILDFSKLDAEMLKLKPTDFSVRELIDELSSELSHFANEKELSLQASSSPEMPAMIKADEYRIKQILRNILGNAIRFTKSGEVSLYADITTQNDAKLLKFIITDTGIGMSPAAQRGVFDSLEQTTKLSNSSFAGRLRLIVSKQLAELMGGEIAVESEIGKGSQFWFTVRF